MGKGNTLTARQLSLLIEIYSLRQTEYSERFGNFPHDVDYLTKQGLIAHEEVRGHVVTDKGKAHIEGILEAPLPLRKWKNFWSRGYNG